MCYPMGEDNMSSGLRIKVVGGIYNVGPIPKVGCTSGIGGIVPMGNTNVFPGA